jgi:diguanylate cyclase (GGDEF)-like protein
MISIQSSLSELERSIQIRSAILDSYVLAIRNLAQYAVELDDEITVAHRKYLEDLANAVASGTSEAIMESRGTLRGLLRDYRDKASEHLNQMREELSNTARTLEELLEGLGQADGDHETNIRSAITRLRQLASSPGMEKMGGAITAATDSIERSLEEVRKQHQITNSQFLAEIRMLHKRIDTLESSAAVDEMTRFATKEELAERIRSLQAGQYCVLLVGARGLRRAEAQFGKEVGDELSGAFAKRLRNSLPTSSAIARWGSEEFAAILGTKKPEAMAVAKWITEHLSGAYACVQAGKTVRPNLQMTVGVVETSTADSPERIIQRIGAFLVGQA